MFYEEEFQKSSKTELKIEKIIKKKGDKLYVKWKADNSLNSWINKKYIVWLMNAIPLNKNQPMFL